ncbi:hypothetical protein [Psychromonas sp. SP041]|uniref:hypothetical protein n=1 Tax=Psychromonas sp. SP041 TaxID=1365007 RepID=UPI000400916B|nr:hypothetical protein [Psychromonas sp. SP041]
MNINLEAWQKAPVKIVLEAIKHSKNKNEEDNLIAFLLLDVGAEMLFKTYLGLPKKITGAITSEDERYNITRKGFHDVVEGVKNSRQGISVKDLARVEFFHGIRNKLYHQGNGLAVHSSHLLEYIDVLKILFKQLLKVELDDFISSSRLSKDQVVYIAKIKKEVSESLEKSRSLKNKLELLSELVIEAISPALLLPSYKRKFSALSEKAFSQENFTLIGEEVHSYKCLPVETDKRADIVEWFKDITKPLLIGSKYYDVLYKSTQAGEHHHIRALGNTLGIKTVEVERQIVPNIFGFIYNDFFDLKSYYKHIVEIVIFQDVYFNNQLNFMVFENDDIHPQFHDQSDIEYWDSTLKSCHTQNQKLNDFINIIDNWLIDDEKLTRALNTNKTVG